MAEPSRGTSMRGFGAATAQNVAEVEKAMVELGIQFAKNKVKSIEMTSETTLNQAQDTYNNIHADAANMRVQEIENFVNMGVSIVGFGATVKASRSEELNAATLKESKIKAIQGMLHGDETEAQIANRRRLFDQQRGAQGQGAFGDRAALPAGAPQTMHDELVNGRMSQLWEPGSNVGAVNKVEVCELAMTAPGARDRMLQSCEDALRDIHIQQKVHEDNVSNNVNLVSVVKGAVESGAKATSNLYQVDNTNDKATANYNLTLETLEAEMQKDITRQNAEYSASMFQSTDRIISDKMGRHEEVFRG